MTPEAATQLLRAAVAELPERSGEVRLHFDGPLCSLVVDNPTARNALTGRMMLQLIEAVDRLAEWDGLGLVLEAAPGPVFCSGGHLGDLRAGLLRPEVGRAMAVAMGAALDRLRAMPFLSIAAVDGLAMGGGAELVTACDWRWMSPGATVHFIHAALGVAPGWGGGPRLGALLGPRVALRVLAEAEPISAARAESLGLADAVTEGPVEAARAKLRSWVGRTPALRGVKAQLMAPSAHAEAFGRLWGSAAHRAALEGR